MLLSFHSCYHNYPQNLAFSEYQPYSLQNYFVKAQRQSFNFPALKLPLASHNLHLNSKVQVVWPGACSML